MAGVDPLPVTEIQFATVKRWCEMTGMGRSTTFEALRAGKLHAVKQGRITLIDVQKGLSYMRSLPKATYLTPPSSMAS